MKAKSLKISLITLTCSLLAVVSAFAQDFPEKPVPPRLVNDFASFLSGQEVSQLENKLVAFNDSTSTQISVVVVPDLKGYDPTDYAQRLAEKWGIGQKDINNGVLILVKPRSGDSGGEVVISTGYGIEGVIPDIVCGEIIDYEIIPSFKNGDYFGGLDRATNVLMALARKEYTAEEYGSKYKSAGSQKFPGIFVIFIIFFILIAIFGGKAGGRNNRNISSKGGLPLWLLLSMMNSGRGSHHGSWGGFSGGGGGFSGGGGGGFGGFGGGSFGGGGASGSW